MLVSRGMVRNFVALLVAAGLLAFVLWLGADSFRRVANYQLENLWLACAIYFVLMLALQFILAESFRFILYAFDIDLSREGAYRVFFPPNLGKYVPGKVMYVLGRVEMLKHNGVPRSTGFGVFLTENLFLVCIASLLSIPAFFTMLRDIEFNVLWVLGFMVLGALAVVASFPQLRRLFDRIWRHGERRIGFEFRRLPRITLGYFVAWSIYGIGGVILAETLIGVSEANYLLIASAFIASWLIGFLSVITPGGLGVREAALVVLLHSIYSTDELAMLAVVSRAMWSLAELLCAMLFTTGWLHRYWSDA